MRTWVRIAIASGIATGGLLWIIQSPDALRREVTSAGNVVQLRGEVSSDDQRAQTPAPNADSRPPAPAAPHGSPAGTVTSKPFPLVYRPVRPLSAEEISFQRSLKPRIVPPKEPLAIPPGKTLRLHIKLADAFRARATGDGRLGIEAASAAAARGFARLAQDLALQYRRVHTVSDDDLRGLERRAAERTLVAQPDLGGLVEAVVPEASRDRIVAAAQALHALPEVEYAELESLDQPPPPPAADIAPTTPLLSANQTYRAAATGINVDYVWNTFGIRGHSSLRLTDCEYQWNVSHEDLAGLVQLQPGLVSMYTAFGDDHGTAVVGVLFAGFNGYGMTGSVPDCDAWFYPEYSTLTSGFQSRAACVTAAIAGSAAGDIVVLEMQASGVTSGVYVPAEYSLSVFTAVQTGSNAGVITIAAAGNGAENLDDTLYSSYMSRGDSGAIIAGAGNTARARQSSSTYGSRVNMQGWGSGVASTGYGTLATYGGDVNQEYASGFSGTSSATTIVASAAALLQSVAIEICEVRLDPAEMRSLLSSTGRAQTGDVSKPIGPLPELQAAVAALLVAHPPGFSTLRSWSLFHFGNPAPALDADPDGDRMSSLLEYVLGTDPESNATGETAHMPRLIVQPGGGGAGTVVFEFHHPSARTGAIRTVQRSTDLAPGSWENLVIGENGVTLTQTGDVCQVSIPTTVPGVPGFFRLHVAVP